MAEFKSHAIELRPKRHTKLPAYLKEYVLDEYKKTKSSSGGTTSSKMGRLILERDFIRDDVDEYCKRVDKLSESPKSKTAILRIEARLETSYKEVKEITQKILDAGEEKFPQEAEEAAHVLSIMKRQIENCQDKISDQLEELKRKDTKPPAPLTLPTGKTPTAAGEDWGDGSLEEGEIRSTDGDIPSMFAERKAVQEKQLYDKKRFEEAKQYLTLEDKLDETERRMSEARLHRKEKKVHFYNMKVEPPQSKVRNEEDQKTVDMFFTSDLQKLKNRPSYRDIGSTGFKETGPKRERRDSSPFRPHSPYPPLQQSYTPQQKREDEEIKRIFQGMAKPTLPKFKGDKEQFADWWEQYEVFVHNADVPIKYKMVMLKSCLVEKPAELVKRLGYSEAQYDLAIKKLHDRFGGENRLLQQHMDAIMAVQPIDQHDLKGLEAFCNRLQDMVAKLIDAGREAEVYGPSSLYTLAMQRIPDNLLVEYKDRRLTGGRDGLFYFTEWLSRQVIIRLEMAELKESVKKSRPGHSSNPTNRNRGDFKKPQKSGAHATTSEDTKKDNASSGTQKVHPKVTSCPICSEKHPTYKCKRWTEASVQERWSMAKEHCICYRCLQVGHQGKNCTSTRKCGKDGCEKTHNRSLHPNKPPPVTETSRKPDTANNAFGMDCHGKVIPTNVALRLIPVYLIGKGGHKRKVTAFLDDGSDSSYIRTEVAKSLGLIIEDGELTIATLVSEGTTVPSGLVGVSLESLDGKTKCTIGTRTLDTLCEGLETPDWTKLNTEWTHLAGITFPKVAGRKRVDLIIGSDHPELAVSLEERIGKRGEPVARLTPLGWTCVGSILPTDEGKHSYFAQSYFCVKKDAFLDEELRRLWNMDVLHTTGQTFTPDEKIVLEKATNSLQFKDNRYQVSIPWRDKVPLLPDNRSAAERRLRNLEASLKRKPNVAEKYKEVFADNLKKGYIQEISLESENEPGWYLPHFGVIREDRTTTKVRVVYDGAAKYMGKSLNDEMLVGPKLQNDLVDILIMFRQGAVALVGDVREMFSQVELDPNDHRYHRLLWRGLEEDSPIRTFESTRLPFGDRAAPFLAQFVVRAHAEKHRQEYPLAADACLTNIYMDDVLKSLESTPETRQLLQQLKELLAKAGFDIRKWCCNHLEVLDGIPENERAVGVLDLEDSELPCIKALGIRWDADKDVLGYSYTPIVLEVVTKRTVLSHVARLFDPLQLLAPFVIRAKMVLQQAWIEGLTWDEPFPPLLEKQVQEWTLELPSVAQFEVPRCYKKDIPEKTTIHTFTDASSLAYGAVVYVRNVYADRSVTIRIIVAKARVTPLKTISIPRLELMAALLGLRLAIRVQELLGCDSYAMHYWTDSMDVIHWMHGQSRKYKPFVSHRIGEIQEHSSPVQWRHVPGVINPADLATRGEKVEGLIGENQWTCGPDFLYKDEEEWPQPSITENPDLTDLAQKEVKKPQCLTAATVAGKEGSKVSSTGDLKNFPIDCTRYSKWIRLLRVTAWVLRFIKIVKSKGQEKMGQVLSVEEQKAAEKILVQHVQHGRFKDTIAMLQKGNHCPSSPLKPLMPFLDGEGILRVGGRLQNSNLPFEVRHPVIIPSRSHIAMLLIRRVHEDCGKHAKGVNAVLAETRQNYWVVHGREEVKRVDRDCLKCVMRKKRVRGQVMAPLPAYRVTVPLRAFAQTGVDYAGPFLVKTTRKCTPKRWICLFTCTTSRAVHLEVAYSLDTDSFLSAFSRMVARRGKPELVVSDNGTNFVGAERELREMLQELDQDRIVEDAANKGIEWRFNPPWGSHHGGVFEALIKSTKRALKAILGEARVTEEEFHTALVEVEGILNSRPLTYCGDDAKDNPVLTPNHFLIGQAGSQLAPRVAEEISCSPRHRWLYTQQLVTQVWKRWNKEFLSLMQTRGKWLDTKEDLHVGDIVLVADPTNPKGKWPLGRILETYPCQDGHVRSVKVLSGGKTFVRPIPKLCALDVSSNPADQVVDAPASDHGGRMFRRNHRRRPQRRENGARGIENLCNNGCSGRFHRFDSFWI